MKRTPTKLLLWAFFFPASCFVQTCWNAMNWIWPVWFPVAINSSFCKFVFNRNWKMAIGAGKFLSESKAKLVSLELLSWIAHLNAAGRRRGGVGWASQPCITWTCTVQVWLGPIFFFKICFHSLSQVICFYFFEGNESVVPFRQPFLQIFWNFEMRSMQ